MIIYIYNYFPYHYEVLPSIIEKYNHIIKREKSSEDTIYLYFKPDRSFRKYMESAYPHVILAKPEKYDYYINCTVYPKDIKTCIQYDRHFYISHTVGNYPSNVFYLTPLCKSANYLYCDVLPYQREKNVAIRPAIPIYVIQGGISSYRRDFSLLEKILENTYEYDFRIKIIGNGKLDDKFKKYGDKIICKTGLPFIEYHKEFLDCYAILPLITKQTHRQYYRDKLTSSINYGLAYNLKFLVDEELQKIYNLENAETFLDENDIVRAFQQTLIDYFKTP
jgi:hypothetical protein